MAETETVPDGVEAGSTLIDISNLTKIYDGDEGTVTALESLDTKISHGEFVSVVGPSGCGKSTLLRLISGLTEPTEGSVNINGEPITGPISDVGFVFQSPVLMDWRNVKQNVLFPYQAMKSGAGVEESKEYYQNRSQELLELVGLDGFENSYPKQLSGGMAQRVAICRALVLNPPILLMDEPFSALDEFTRDKLNEEILDIWQETEKTILFITHNIQEAVFLSDRILVLSDRPGKIIVDVEIDIDRPRSLDIRNEPEFMEYVTQVRDAINI